MYIHMYIYIVRVRIGGGSSRGETAWRAHPRSERWEVLLRGSALYDICKSSVKTLLVKCPSVQRQPDGLTIHTHTPKSGS